MNSMILGLLAETSIHPGAGQSAGFVDLPVAREAATDYPVIVGSSMKGALRDRARNDAQANIDISKVFGEQESGGSLLVSDARLILLPVRSLKTQYKWVTCPHLIERLSRDRARETAGWAFLPVSDAATGRNAHPTKTIDCVSLEDHQYLGADNEDLFLEERQFSPAGPIPKGLIELIRPLMAHDDTRKRLPSQLVIISNDDFVWFARYGLAVNAHNVLDKENKTSKNLWYEETIPPDALFYCLLAERNDGALAAARKLFEASPYLQVGGNETVGQGWFAVAVPPAVIAASTTEAGVA